MSTTPDEAMQMVTDCKARESRLSEWEAEFVDSIRRRLDRGFGYGYQGYDHKNAALRAVAVRYIDLG